MNDKKYSDFQVTTITTNDQWVSVFSQERFAQQARGGMLLSDRIEALNLRLRESSPGYRSDWHMAGDATLIVIQQGTLRIILRDGSYQDFSSGDCFIARDALPDNVAFDNNQHGHRAEVIGDQSLLAVHIKLS